MKILKWMFPHGVGTRAIIAIIIVLATLPVIVLNAATAKEVLLLVLSCYFVSKAGNGNGSNGNGATKEVTNGGN